MGHHTAALGPEWWSAAAWKIRQTRYHLQTLILALRDRPLALTSARKRWAKTCPSSWARCDMLFSRWWNLSLRDSTVSTNFYFSLYLGLLLQPCLWLLCCWGWSWGLRPPLSMTTFPAGFLGLGPVFFLPWRLGFNRSFITFLPLLPAQKREKIMLLTLWPQPINCKNSNNFINIKLIHIEYFQISVWLNQ